MGRRSRRRRSSPSRANPRSYSGLRPRNEVEHDQVAPSQAGSGPAVAEPQPQPQPSPTVAGKNQADWKAEYSRVFSDLKQLLIVSVALFAVMLVVGFFL